MISDRAKVMWINIPEPSSVCVPDPIAFIGAFAEVLWGLVPRDVVRSHENEISTTMDELAKVLIDMDGSSWSKSRQVCTECAYAELRVLNLTNGNLGSKLRIIGRTWPTILWRMN